MAPWLRALLMVCNAAVIVTVGVLLAYAVRQVLTGVWHL